MWRMGLVLVVAGAFAEACALGLPWNGGHMSLATLLTWPDVEVALLPLGLTGAVATLLAAIGVLAGSGRLGLRRGLVAVAGVLQFLGLGGHLLSGGAIGSYVFAAGAVAVLFGGLIGYRVERVRRQPRQ